MIEARGLTRRFGSTLAVDHVSFEVAEGAKVALLGANGAGKTTLLALLSTLLSPSEGEATVAGHDLASDGSALRASIGVLTHRPMLYEELTPQENLRFFARLYSVADADEADRGAAAHGGAVAAPRRADGGALARLPPAPRDRARAAAPPARAAARRAGDRPRPRGARGARSAGAARAGPDRAGGHAPARAGRVLGGRRAGAGARARPRQRRRRGAAPGVAARAAR